MHYFVYKTIPRCTLYIHFYIISFGYKIIPKINIIFFTDEETGLGRLSNLGKVTQVVNTWLMLELGSLISNPGSFHLSFNLF